MGSVWLPAESKADRIKADFEAKYPQYEVEYIDLGSQDYLVRLDTMVASGERLDMALTMDGVEYTARAKEGMFMPIGKYLTEDGFDLYDAFGDGIKASFIGDEIYGLPYTKGGFMCSTQGQFDAAGTESYGDGLGPYEKSQSLTRVLGSTRSTVPTSISPGVMISTRFLRRWLDVAVQRGNKTLGNMRCPSERCARHVEPQQNIDQTLSVSPLSKQRDPLPHAVRQVPGRYGLSNWCQPTGLTARNSQRGRIQILTSVGSRNLPRRTLCAQLP